MRDATIPAPPAKKKKTPLPPPPHPHTHPYPPHQSSPRSVRGADSSPPRGSKRRGLGLAPWIWFGRPLGFWRWYVYVTRVVFVAALGNRGTPSGSIAGAVPSFVRRLWVWIWGVDRDGHPAAHAVVVLLVCDLVSAVVVVFAALLAAAFRIGPDPDAVDEFPSCDDDAAAPDPALANQASDAVLVLAAVCGAAPARTAWTRPVRRPNRTFERTEGARVVLRLMVMVDVAVAFLRSAVLINPFPTAVFVFVAPPSVAGSAIVLAHAVFHTAVFGSAVARVLPAA
mmetsp:Transcript_10625/g.12946  ORF Transcript_10625/g.12946 Transcript_10625/m.12946 type:complete len:283 (-) Transcript_10625:69-917(-)